MSEHPIKGIDVHTFAVKDAARATAFWRDVMGLTPAQTSERGAEFALPDGSYFELWQPEDGDLSHGLMFAVDDLSQAVAYYRSKGVNIVGEQETPVCRMAFAADSEGNHFVLHQRKDGTAGNDRAR